MSFSRVTAFTICGSPIRKRSKSFSRIVTITGVVSKRGERRASVTFSMARTVAGSLRLNFSTVSRFATSRGDSRNFTACVSIVSPRVRVILRISRCRWKEIRNTPPLL